MVGACSGRSAWRWRNCSPGCPTAPDRARRGRHLPCTPLTGVTFCEGAPPARGGTADGARALGPVLARLVAHAGRAILSIGDECDRLLDRCCRRPGCWLRVLPVAAGCSRWFAFRQVETQLDLRRAASPGYLHLHRITADDVPPSSVTRPGTARQPPHAGPARPAGGTTGSAIRAGAGLRSCRDIYCRTDTECETGVVLPWSTCATMATLRRSSLVARAGEDAGRGKLRC
jgi:hypothetical protein